MSDKTDGGANGPMSNVVFVLAPDRQPVIITVYITVTPAPFDNRNVGIASIARVLK